MSPARIALAAPWIVAFALLAGEGTARAASFTKGPFLQWLGPTGVTVKLELSEPAEAKLEVLAGGKPVATKASDGARAFHALRVEGLTPGTAFEYRVTTGDGKTETGHFTTAPGDDRPFRFLVYGDSRSDPEAHAAVARAMERATSDFLVNTGDMVYAGRDDRDWMSFFTIENKLLRDRCVFAAVGNHELSRGDPSGEVAFLRYFAPVEDGREQRRLYGTFRWSNTRFFLLNAMDQWTGEERDWLRAELDKAMGEPGLLHRIAVLHHGPFSSGPHGGNAALVNNGVAALMRDRKVDLVLAGHDHVYERGEGDGLKYVISGGSGAPLYPRQHQARETIAFEAVHHFVEVAVDGEKVDLVARRASGSVIEAIGFRGTGGWERRDKDGPAQAPGSAPAKTPASAPPPAEPARAGCACGVPGVPAGEGAGALALGLLAAAALRRRPSRDPGT